MNIKGRCSTCVYSIVNILDAKRGLHLSHGGLYNLEVGVFDADLSNQPLSGYLRSSVLRP